ncbi:modification methylase [Campylobacter sp. LR291e]|uniref:DNA adenine methylase n=1 Tax=Campylobacter sp. LR291e TaxID=2593546 RepID=UPI00123B9ED4|nr:DNA adenine methylase [Campylobacter sp. LR291e]KAA6231613.1 modification methylase [Campylobacter sp. LR291e]
MNYIGSKFRLSDFLFENIDNTLKGHNAKPLSQSIFCDLFAGSCAVSKLFKGKVKQIIVNDKEFYSFVLAKNYIGNYIKLNEIGKLLDSLNDATLLIKGKIFTHYALGGGENRQYFSDENAKKIDTIRTKIEELKQENSINENEYFFLLASLLESADKVANTASVYGAFLKHLKKSAQKKMILSPANFEICNGINEPQIFNENARDLITKINGDILYLDPPYNARQYGANYHLLNSIAIYDDFIPQGKTGLRYYEKSAWCKKMSVENELEFIIKNANFKFIFLSYNDEGLLSLEQIQNIFKKYGKYELSTKIHQRFKADSKRTQKQNSTIEYLHILNKDG